MTKRRKNAGEGYGYMFHGSFTEKSDAVAKERSRPGSFIKHVYTNQGWRYLVMSPRKNPIRRKRVNASRGLKPFTKAQEKAVYLYRHMSGQYPGTRLSQEQEWKVRMKLAKLNAKHNWSMAQVAEASRLNYWPGQNENPISNPSELLVMGANPHQSRELNLPAGSTITIRVNPLSNPICGVMVQGEACTRKPHHRGPHLPQGATMRPASRLRHGWKPRKKNPSAAAIREEFTGAPAEHYTVHDEPNMPAGDYAQLGELLALYVKPLHGGQVQAINFRSGERPLLVSDETARQLYFVGGDQDVSSALSAFGVSSQSGTDAGGLIHLGEARRIDYKQRKEHVPDPDVDEWRHEFGEETHVHPKVLFDPLHKQLILQGGEYVVRREGIVN